ncbi:TIGR03364 family FAD-dependent oxidoreductase [Inquilinus limosus]|uniref:TIGR03364 family FAD-dependent oxidoreductase n=1 Tax=Inquilinus limosus TaxID=171674 RepID=UPI000409FBD2|nr:TIGR03364 family FAD-dependent oxidoreductase [Inquilinus limosus]
MTQDRYDLAVVGAGILGLAHALAAARQGRRVVVIDREARAIGASIRNFGFVTVTGQSAGPTWRRAMRSRDVWAELAPRAGIPVLHRGTALLARTPEGLGVLEAFARTEMGQGCERLTAAGMAARLPMAADGLLGGLWSPHELRIEPREAIPRLAAWLEAAHGVAFRRGVQVRAVQAPRVETSDGAILADRVVVCPGPDLRSLFPEVMARRRTTLCKLQMLRLAAPGWRLPAAVMGDLSFARYRGYADLPEAAALKARLAAEVPETLAEGIHLIVVQSADGSLVVGDSHHYDDAPDPFASQAVEALILRHMAELLQVPDPAVAERWVGIYPSGPEEAFAEAPDAATRVVQVTSGTGMSTGFAIAEEVVAELFGAAAPRHAA